MSELREIRFKDDKIFKLLQKKDELIAKSRHLLDEFQKFEEKGKIANNKIQVVKDKVKPLIEKKEEDFDLDEFELVASVEVDGDEVVAKVVDQIEAYKELLRKQNEGTTGDSNGGERPLEADKQNS